MKTEYEILGRAGDKAIFSHSAKAAIANVRPTRLAECNVLVMNANLAAAAPPKTPDYSGDTPENPRWYQAMDAMDTFGGDFVKKLAVAWRHADAENNRRLMTAFPEYYAQYVEMARVGFYSPRSEQ